MILTTILILIYWLILSTLSFFVGPDNYFQAFFPSNFKDLFFRLIGVFFILAGNLYLLFRKKNRGRRKSKSKASVGQTEQSFSEEDIEYSNFNKNEQENISQEISIEDRYLIHKTVNSIIKLAFNNVSVDTFMKLGFNLILSDKHFIDCNGVMGFFIGDQPQVLQLKAYSNIPSSVVQNCRIINFNKCGCGKAVTNKTIQFFKNNTDDCPLSSSPDFNNQHKHYCVPLMYQGNLLGVIDLILSSESKRTKEADEYLMAVANNLAIGIKYKQRIERTVDINKCLSELIGNPEENIKRLVNLYGEISGASSAFYKRYDQKTDSLSSFAQYNPPRHYDDQEAEGSIGFDILKEQKQFVIIRNLAESKYIKRNLNIIRNDFFACAGSIVKARGELVGVIYVFYKQDFKPDKKDEDNLKMIASAIGTEEERIYENKVLKEAYSKLKKAQGSLVQSEKLAALGRFSSGIAHEVKNPLGVVLGGIEFLEKKINNPEKDIKFALTKVKDSTLRANSIVQNLLTFAKPSERKNEVIDLPQLIGETLSLLKYKVSLVNIKIINEAKEMPEGIVGDKNQIQQVLFNLFLNAIESMSKGGKLKVRISKTSDIKLPKGRNNCLIEIIDTGEGISEENLTKIFEPFFTTKRDTKGTGLGLAMCKMIIENNDGKLLIKSTIHKGTTAQIILPINPKS